MICRSLAVFLVLASIAVPANALAQPTVSMTDLGTLPGGTYSNAIAINAAGDAVGLAVRADGLNRAVLFRNGAVIDLGSLCDHAACPNNYSNASDINDHGTIVGSSYDAAGQLRAFIWENNVMTMLPIPAGSSSTAATAINNAGEIVGRSCGAAGCRAVRWSTATSVPQTLGLLGTAAGTSYSSAVNLNEAGQVVGESTITGGTFRMHGFVWDSVNGMRDLGGGGDACFDRNWAAAINSRGDISGGLYLGCGTYSHMARWIGGVVEDLGSLRGPTFGSSAGWAISEAGDIPGSSVGACGEWEAVVWSQGVMIPLGGPDVVRPDCHMSSASGINNRGQIVGQIYTGNDSAHPGEVRAALWQMQVSAPPTVTCAGPDVASWHAGNVIVACTASSEAGLANPADAGFTLTTTGEGAALVTNAHAAICDMAGQCTTPVGPFGPYKVDKTAPVVVVAGVTDGATYAFGSGPAPGCVVSDALSGVQTQATVTSSGGPLGAVTFTCSGAIDNAGNAAAAVSASVSFTKAIPINSLALATSTALASASALAISPDERHVYAVLAHTSPAVTAGLAVMNAETYAIESIINLGGGIPFEIAVSRDGTRAYVAISKSSGATTVADDARVAVIDIGVSPPTIVTEIPLMLTPTAKAAALTGVAVHPWLPRLYVSDRGANRVFVIDTTTNTQVSSMVVAGGALGSSGPVGLKVTPDGTRLYVVNRGTPAVGATLPISVTEVDLGSGVATRIPSALRPSGSLTMMTITPDGKHAFFAANVATENRVAVLDIDPASSGYRTESFVQTSALTPLRGLAVTHDGEYVYATDQGGNSVFVIATDTMSVVRSIQVGAGPSGVVTRQAPGAKAFVSVSGRIAIIAAPAPIVSAGPNVTGDEGAAIVLVGSVTDVDSPDVVRAWTYTPVAGATGSCAFGDASAAATSITCTDNGDYAVTLTVNDGDNEPASSSAVVHITNAVPAAVFTAPVSVDEQQSFALALTGASDASPADAAAGFTFSFDCGSGYGAFSPNASIACTAPILEAGNPSLTVGGQVRDKDGGVKEYLAAITLGDTTAPILSLLNASATATTGTSTAVTFTATATDLVDGALTPSCSPASGSTFAIGTTTVQCSAADARGNTASGTLTVTVLDGVAPVITVPASLTREAASASGLAVTFTASAADNHDPSLTASCAPASGSMFALGDTSVTCSATDAAGNSGAASFTITIADTTAPALHLPPNQSLIATSPAGAPVSVTATASDTVSGAVTVTCTLGAGAIAPIGTTAVNCSATDGAGNTAYGSFSVSVAYNTCLLYDTSKASKSGSTVPIKLQLCSATGQNLSSPAVAVQAQSLVLVSTNASGPVEDAGKSNPDGNFRYDASFGGYIFNLKTTGLPAGSFELRFTAGNAPGLSGAPFKIR